MPPSNHIFLKIRKVFLYYFEMFSIFCIVCLPPHHHHPSRGSNGIITGSPATSWGLRPVGISTDTWGSTWDSAAPPRWFNKPNKEIESVNLVISRYFPNMNRDCYFLHDWIWSTVQKIMTITMFKMKKLMTFWACKPRSSLAIASAWDLQWLLWGSLDCGAGTRKCCSEPKAPISKWMCTILRLELPSLGSVF